jgi:membrane-bound serine protease (ClpP class)
VDYTLLWAIVLMLVSLGFLVLETFVPSWGVLGFFAAASAIGGIALAFSSSPLHGFAVLGASLVIFPVVVYYGFKWWPNTPVGRRVLLPVPTEEQVLPDTPQLRQLKQLVGRLGRAKTVMLPSGPVDFDGQTVDCVSEGMPIETGQVVKVIEVRGSRVVVRAVDEDIPPPRKPADDENPKLRPLDSLGLDELEEG